MLGEFEQEVVNLGLKKILGGNRFWMYELKSLGDSIGINIRNHPDYHMIDNLSGVDYKDMPDIVYNTLPERIMGMLSSNRVRTVDTQLMSQAIAAIANGEIKPGPISIEDFSLHDISEARRIKNETDD